jgi:hypothetical protein
MALYTCRTLAAGPTGVIQAGATVELTDDEARPLLAGRYIEVAIEKPPEVTGQMQSETAIAKPPARTAVKK